jgi:hypothetical protein
MAKIERMRSPTTRLRFSFLAYPRSPAAQAVRVHPLRATDALQLAAAFLTAERQPPSLEMVTLDDVLPMQHAGRDFAMIDLTPVDILFSTDTDSILAKILGKNCREASSWENASAKFECREIL